MKLSSFSAAFKDYELDLNYYHGKDLLHQGCLLRLDPVYSWEKINSKIRNKIRKAQKLGVEIKRVQGDQDDIKAFRSIWFDPKDQTIPSVLEDNEIMYMAYLNGELTGGLILTPSTPTVLYMHNLGANEQGKRNNIPALLLWHAVEDLAQKDYQYIDVGVSFRPTLYTFFKNWRTDTYPIIFNPPFIKPDIRLTPFVGSQIVGYENMEVPDREKTIEAYFGKTYTVLPRAIHCLKAVLKYHNLKKTDTVAVYKTFKNDYITRCVTDPIEESCRVVREIDENTKAVLVIHEFGFPCKEIMSIKDQCKKKNIPLIEDCAWAYGTAIDDHVNIGDVGDYAIYSLPKILPMQYGGVLKGLEIDDETNWNEFQTLDYFKREIILNQLAQYLPELSSYNKKRQENWRYLQKLFKQDGFEAFGDLEQKTYPGSFVIKTNEVQDLFRRYEDFSVETGRYYPEDALYLPVHQNLETNQLNYLYGIFRGKLNLSSNYRRDGKRR